MTSYILPIIIFATIFIPLITLCSYLIKVALKKRNIKTKRMYWLDIGIIETDIAKKIKNKMLKYFINLFGDLFFSFIWTIAGIIIIIISVFTTSKIIQFLN